MIDCNTHFNSPVPSNNMSKWKPIDWSDQQEHHVARFNGRQQYLPSTDVPYFFVHMILCVHKESPATKTSNTWSRKPGRTTGHKKQSILDQESQVIHSRWFSLAKNGSFFDQAASWGIHPAQRNPTQFNCWACSTDVSEKLPCPPCCHHRDLQPSDAPKAQTQGWESEEKWFGRPQQGLVIEQHSAQAQAVMSLAKEKSNSSATRR